MSMGALMLGHLLQDFLSDPLQERACLEPGHTSQQVLTKCLDNKFQPRTDLMLFFDAYLCLFWKSSRPVVG